MPSFSDILFRPITDEEIETYKRDGVVCLRQVFDRDWIDSLLEKSREIVVDRKDFGLLPTMPGRYMARCIPEFRRFVFESPLACLLYTSPSPRDATLSRMPSSA